MQTLTVIVRIVIWLSYIRENFRYHQVKSLTMPLIAFFLKKVCLETIVHNVRKINS